MFSAGDHIAGMLAVAVASSRTLEVVDLEGTGLTNQSAQVDQSLTFSLILDMFINSCGNILSTGAGLTEVLMFSVQVFLDMVENYPTSLRVLVLAENTINPELQQQICDLLSEGEDDNDREAPPLEPRPTPSCTLLPVRVKYQPTKNKQQPLTWFLPHSSKG